MTTTVNFQAGVRNQKDQPQISTVKASDMAAHIKADGARIVMDNEGVGHFHLTNSADGNYFSVKIGGKVKLTKTGNDAIGELLNNYVVYTGNTLMDGTVLEKPWFTFGPIPSPTTPVAEVKAADLAKMLQAATQSLKAGA